MLDDTLNKAGSVEITELVLLSKKNIGFDLTPFLVEFNLYEDIFSNHLYGNIVVSDSFNLIEKVPIETEELIAVDITTPTLPQKFKKIFKIYKISDRSIIRDNNTQVFAIHFASVEFLSDMLLPLFIPFQGVIGDVVEEIFTNYIATETELRMLSEPSNKVKFVATGWTPFKCINWLASRSIPKDETNKTFLFYESNQAYYFVTVDYLFKQVARGKYIYSVSNVRDGKDTPDINREMFIIKNLDMVETTDMIKNNTNGYTASRLITLDIYNKEYKLSDYIHDTDIEMKNPAGHMSFYPINGRLFQTSASNYFKENVNEKIIDIYSNRRSNMLELTNKRLNITVPGRTDMEVGNMIYISYPALGYADESDSATPREDKLYSGDYLITAIHHKISKLDHSMIMECVKKPTK